MEIDKNDKGMFKMEPITPQRANTVQPGNMVMSPEIWRDIFDAIEDPAFLHDVHFRVLLANRAYCRAAGVTEAQALGKPYWEVFPLGTGPLPGCKDAMDRKGHGGSQEEVSVGAKLFFSKGYTVHDDQGKSLHALHLLSDITAQRQADAALRKSKDLLQSIVENMPARIFWKDRDSRYLGCNTQFAKDFGYASPDELVGKTVFEMGRKDQAELYRADDKAVMDSGQPKLDYDESATTPDGKTSWVRTSKVPLRDESKQVIGMLGLSQDITDRKRIAVQREQYFKFFMLSMDPMCIADPLGCFKQVNPAFMTLTGYSEAELVARPFLDFILPEDRQRTVDEMALQVKLRPSLKFENHYLRKDGSAILLSWTAYFDEKEGVTYGTARDITLRKQDELALERANRALRTLSACNEALVRAGNEAELLDAICRLIVEVGGYRMAWVGFPEPDAAKTVRPVAQYGHEKEYLAAANISWADSERGHGPTGTAMRIGTVQINQNFLTNPALLPWREAALERGYQSSIALPLTSAAGTLGVLTLYAAAPDAFNETEVILLQELAGDLAFGIENLRTHAERDRIAHEQHHHTEILRQSLEESIKAIANTVEMRDPYTAGHQRRVGQLAAAIARELGLPEDTMRGIELAASIHDLGKISVPAEILAKPTKLTAIEFMLLKNHAQAGFDIIKDIKFPWPIATMVLQHHERQDGSGYPQGLKGEQILLESRIMAVADVVEAMASHRPYRAALGIDSALQEIERGRGTVYDAAVVDACLRLFTEKRFTFSS